jgi:hypothetical protein
MAAFSLFTRVDQLDVIERVREVLSAEHDGRVVADGRQSVPSTDIGSRTREIATQPQTQTPTTDQCTHPNRGSGSVRAFTSTASQRQGGAEERGVNFHRERFPLSPKRSWNSDSAYVRQLV